ncbi:hypothetical protein Aph02nite_45520 [Actinoplanes philippinensis]|uniref:Uncharacterized protein n=1 Tax=Actinoplanes philippinensis TaxID=35752 RepID=A0A1I2I782_9ACTN|nr:hypothetical protein [Actinoplanes philippinensis]GIE78602.1 hypothetical protein Aph02nite_45520 [Actinoplanes philippinensis]SFF37488.1 hypothetical protein SAMN05421541_109329 [Actinoplanes philippinensis]
MTDLREYFDEIADSVTSTATTDVEADVVRGRRAVRRRRVVQTVAGSIFGVAAIVAAFTIPSAGVGSGPFGPTAAAPPAVARSLDLVAYQGPQPKGFTLDTVPAGWFVQSDARYSLLLAPQGSGAGPDSAAGKIVIYLESRDQNGPPRAGAEVEVGDRDGVLVKSLPAMIPGQSPPPADGDTGWTIWVEQPHGVHLIVQFGEGLGLDREQMVALTAGVHVHEEALQGIG